MLNPGAMVDHFRVMRRIGQGGMGEVYLARDSKLGRKVALKVIHRDNISSQEAVEQLNFEARATARLNHPHIVTIYAVGEHSGVPYVALEYLEGQTLRQRVREERPGVREVLRLGLAIAKALEAAHRHNILHLDLKPENVLIPRDGRLRVVDFGLAGIMRRGDPGVHPDDTVSTTMDEITTDDFFEERRRGVRGSPPYMAPERWLEKESSGATDMWSLGVILYELVTGSRPFDCATVVELATRVVSADPAPAVGQQQAGHSRNLPADLARLIDGCLLKDPEQRPSAARAVEVLESLVHRSRGRVSEEASPFRGLLPFSERHADYFFGRDDEILAFLEHARNQPVLPVVGPSGAGKSSFVQAGVIPRLREQGGWMVLGLRPGSDPFRVLASRLICGEVSTDAFGTSTGALPGGDELQKQSTEVGNLCAELQKSAGQLSLELSRLAAREKCRVLLFVDQLEELCTLVDDPDVRRRFMEAICTAADDPREPVRVVFTLREDFLSRLAEGAGVREALSRVTVIRSPDPEALAELLLRPLEMVGYALEDPALCQEMTTAVSGEAAALPLLQFAAHMLWTRRDPGKKLLTRAAYETIGGVEGALAEHADGVLEGLSSSEVLLARKVLLRLVTAEGTRRVVFRDSLLEGLGPEAEDVLGRLVQARLISGRKSYSAEGTAPGLELVHESLISTWGRLARWIDEGREELAFLQEVSQAAQLWRKRGHREEEVWQGEALQEALIARRRCSTPLPELSARFLEAGQQKTRRVGRRKRAVVALAITLLALAAAIFYHQKEQAENQRQEAERQRGEARERWADAQREGARAAFLGGHLLEARAKLRGALEVRDSAEARALWWKLTRDQTAWTKELGATAYDVDFSPDGGTVAAACQDKAVYLFDVKTRRTRILRGHDDQVFSLAFSPDGQKLATGTWSGVLRLWDLRSGAVRVLRGHTEGVRRLAFSPDGKRLASASYDDTVRLWDLAGDGAPRVLRGHEAQISGLSYSPDGKSLATASRDKTVRLWDLTARGGQARVLRGHEAGVYAVSHSPDGKLLASGSFDNTVRLWDLATGKQLRVLTGHRARINDLAFSPDGRQLASASFDRTIRLWHVASGKLARQISAHGAWISSVAYSPRGRYLVSASADKTVRLWDLRSAAAVHREPGHRAPVYSAAFSPGGASLASSDKAGVIWLWDARSGRTRRALRGHQGVVNSVAFSPDGKLLASAGNDHSVRLWSVDGSSPPRTLQGHVGGVNFVTFSPDGKTLASSAMDNTIRLWDLPIASCRVLSGHRGGVKEVAFSPNGKQLASTSNDGTARLWDVRSGAPTASLKLTSEGASISFSPDGELLALSENQVVRLWDPTSPGSRLFKRFSARVYHLVFHPDGDRLGISLSDGTARILVLPGRRSPFNGVHDQVLRGHRDEVNFIAFDGTGALAVTASDDNTVRLWLTRTGEPRWWASLLTTGTRSPVKTAWQAAAKSRGRWGHTGSSLLCLQTRGALEVWDLKADERLSSTVVPGIQDTRAFAGGCVVRTDKAALLYTTTGAYKQLAPGASAIAVQGNQILVAAGSRVLIFDAQGKRLAAHEAGVGVKALARSGDRLAVGFGDGNIEVIRTAGKRGPSFSFEGVPSSPVVRLLAGPMGTLIAGYANGLLGIWKLDSGALLHSVRLHGPVVHMVLEGGKLHAASELGDHARLDLGVFRKGYCQVLHQVWRRVPVVWDSGLPVTRQPDRKHPCFKRKK